MWAAGLSVLALLVLAVIPIHGVHPAERSLYETAALVIPLLILALAVDHAWRPGWDFLLLLIVLGFLVAGEFASMIGTAYDVQTRGHKDFLLISSRPLTDILEFFAVAGLGVGLIAVLWGLVFRDTAPGPRERPSHKHLRKYERRSNPASRDAPARRQ